MTAYNREKYIGEAIESVLQSTYTNFELIIVDDCSKDKTVGIAREFEAKDARIKVYVNDKNIDQFPNRNRAAALAKGAFIMYVDSDDTIKRDGIEYVIKQFKNCPAAKFATIYSHPDINHATCVSPKENIHKHFFGKNHLHAGPGGTAIRTEYFKEIGGFPTNYGPAGDSYYNIKAACNTNVILLPYVYFNYRIHGEQEFYRKYAYLYNNYLYFQGVMNLPELPITANEKRFLLLKSKRTFLINSLDYFKSTNKLNRTIRAYKLAGIGIKDIWSGVFSNLKKPVLALRNKNYLMNFFESKLSGIRKRIRCIQYGMFYLRNKDFKIRAALLINGNKTTLNLANANISEFTDICLNDCYRLNFLKSKLQSVNTVIDVGANHGLFLIAARQHFPGADITSYEPNQQLKDSLSFNASQLKGKVYYEAVMRNDCKVALSLTDSDLATVTHISEQGTVPGISFKKVIERAGLVDILKLDCEGAEWELLEDIESWKNVRALTIEYHLLKEHYSSTEIFFQLLNKINFSVAHHTILTDKQGLVVAVNNAHF